MNQIKNSGSKCQVGQISNVRFIDIVRKSKEFDTSKNQCVNINLTRKTTDRFNVDNPTGEESIQGDEIENTTEESTVDIDPTQKAKDVGNGQRDSNFDENTKEKAAKETDDATSMFDPIIVKDEHANAVKVVSQMKDQNKIVHDETTKESNFDPAEKILIAAKKITNFKARNVSLEDCKKGKTVPEEKKTEKCKIPHMSVSSSSDIISGELAFECNEMPSFYNNYLTSNSGGNENTTRAEEMKSTIVIQNKIPRELFTNTDSFEINTIDHMHQENNSRDVHRLSYESSGDIPNDKTETKSGMKWGENALEKYNIIETSNENKIVKSQSRKQAKSRRKTNRKYLIKNNVNTHNHHKTAHEFICTIAQLLLIAFLLASSICAMIDRKLNKHNSRCVKADKMNQTCVAKEYLKLHMNTEIIDAKLKYLMNIYLVDNYDISKNYNGGTKGVIDDEAFGAEKEWMIPHLKKTQKALTQLLKLRKQLYKDFEVLKKEIRLTMKQLANMQELLK